MARDRQKTELFAVGSTGTHSRQDIGIKTLAGEALREGIFSDRGALGVHYVVRRSGTIEIGRDVQSEGQHLAGYNDVCIFILLVGGCDKFGQAQDNFTRSQLESLESLVKVLWLTYPSAILAPQHELTAGRNIGLDLWKWETETVNSGHERRLREYLATRVDPNEAVVAELFDAE